MENKNSQFKCWICKDSGMVFFIKNIYGIEYEYSYRCTCIKGQSSSDIIKTVPSVLAENIAIENYQGSLGVDSTSMSKANDEIEHLKQSNPSFNISLFQ